MGQRASILIVDNNPGFALMLKEGLEEEATCRATVVPTGPEALDAASRGSFDLAIVDLGLQAQDDLDGEAVARKLREVDPDLSLIVIPLQGSELPDDLRNLGVQGTLPKPFFLPDLPDLVETALGGPVKGPGTPAERETQPGPGVPESPPVPDKASVTAQSVLPEQRGVKEVPEEGQRPTGPQKGRVPGRTSGRAREEVSPESAVAQSLDAPELRGDTEDGTTSRRTDEGSTGDGVPSPLVEAWTGAATAEIERLAREVNADAVVVTHRGDIVASAGRIRDDRRHALAQSIWDACQLSGMAARSLGREPSDFEQAVEGESYALYTLTIEDGLLLSAVLRSDTTLGVLRHQARRTARRLRAALIAPQAGTR